MDAGTNGALLAAFASVFTEKEKKREAEKAMVMEARGDFERAAEYSERERENTMHAMAQYLHAVRATEEDSVVAPVFVLCQALLSRHDSLLHEWASSLVTVTINTGSMSYHDTSHWLALFSHVLLGRMHAAVSTLDIIEAMLPHCAHTLRLLKRAIQSRPNAASSSISNTTWSTWRHSTVQFCDTDTLRVHSSMSNQGNTASHDSHLRSISTCFSLLVGDLNAIIATASLLVREGVWSTDYLWMPCFATFVSYKDPLWTLDSLPSHLDTLREAIPDSVPFLPQEDDTVDESDPIDRFEVTVISLLELEMDVAVLKYMPFLHWPAAVHLMDIFNTISRLNHLHGNVSEGHIYFGGEDAVTVVDTVASSNPTNQKLTIRNSIILEYALSLSNNPNTEWIAVSYLVSLSRENVPEAQFALERVLISIAGSADLESRIIRKVMSVAKSAGIQHNVGRSVYASRAKHCVDTLRLGEAIVNYFEAGLIERCNATANVLFKKLLEEYENAQQDQSRQEIRWSRTVSQLPARVVKVSPQAALCVKLVEFQNAFTSSETVSSKASAGAHLLELLTHGLAPRNFWPYLLVDSYALLESGVVLGVQETFELLRCLEDVSQDESIQWDGRGICDDRMGGRVSVATLRLALSKNLSRAMMMA
ncbi:Nup85 nucleoporin-domain-containing protein [Chytriomyces cf. hyalinus JEL632]|nr:Nup85 nucleoporin-domain-containing protein [Chytriomyces cf. hyalinus JEL632]